MDIIVSDFDDTLFKRNVGLLPTVQYIKNKGLPVYVVTYRAENQAQFILDTLRQGGINLIGIACGGSRKKDPHVKARLLEAIMSKHNVIEALDDDLDVVILYKSMGVKAIKINNGMYSNLC